MFFLRNDISTVSRIMVVQMKLLTTCRDLIQFSSATGYEKGKISENEMEKGGVSRVENAGHSSRYSGGLNLVLGTVLWPI